MTTLITLCKIIQKKVSGWGWWRLVSKFCLCLQLSWPPSDNDHVTIDARVQKHMHEIVSQ